MSEPSVIVRKIIKSVRRRGDRALCELAEQYDHVRLSPSQIVLSKQELASAHKYVSDSYLKAIKKCAKSIEAFALYELKRLSKSWLFAHGTVSVGQLIRPVESAGLYIPGGRFPYPSTVLMSAIPARVAGVRRIVMASPSKNLTPEVLVAAQLAGCEAVYRVGGPGAIAALAYGTRRIQKVDFIVGPGNQYVTEAKRQVFGDVGIDSLAGPSEVVIVADRDTPVEYVQLDLQAQAEHDPEARSLLLSTDRLLIKRVQERLSRDLMKRVELRYVNSIPKAIELANEIAPEHLELLFRDAKKVLPHIRHAGAIFLGPTTPAALGDYVAGPSHVLPTNRSARYSSGLSVASFFKRSSVIAYAAQPAEKPDWEAALVMGQTEGMENHAASLRLRMSR